MLSVLTIVGLTTAFTPPTTVPGVQRVTVSRTAEVAMMAAPKKGLFNFGTPASPTKPKVTKKATPLSPGSNYPATKNIQTQSNGFGIFFQKFQTVSGKSKYGMPIFLPNGNINPAYLAAERKEQAAVKAKNIQATGAKVKKLIAKKDFELADYVRKKIGEVGSGKDYYQSGR